MGWGRDRERVITELTEQGEGTENSPSLPWPILLDGIDSVGIAAAPCPHHPRCARCVRVSPPGFANVRYVRGMQRVITERTEQGEGTENSQRLWGAILLDGIDSVGIAAAP